MSKYLMFLVRHSSSPNILGGCGTMFRLDVGSPLFKGKSMLQQHRMVKISLSLMFQVQDLLANEIKQMHGLTIKTRVVEKKT
jgi:stress-induced morphogen